MNGIGDFLKRYLNFTPPEKVISKAAARALEEVFESPFKEENISVRNNTVFVSTDSVFKSEILFQKHKLLNRIKELTGNTLTDIH